MLFKHDPPVQLHQRDVVPKVGGLVRRVHLLPLHRVLLVGVPLARVAHVPLAEAHAQLRVRGAGTEVGEGGLAEDMTFCEEIKY